MGLLPIATYDDDVLREKAVPIEEDSDELQELIEDMFDTMYNANGVGLAGPQVGVRRRIFVADADAYGKKKDEEPEYGPLVLINPSIRLQSEEAVTIEEGCLSIPEVRGEVTRPEAITVSFKDRDFNDRTLEVGGALARIIQHEIDHLNGVLFIDHLSYFKRKLVAPKLKKLAEGSREIDYPVVSKES